MASVSDPSFGVLAASTVPKVAPPSVDSEIFTSFASRWVLLTAQVTGTDEPPATVAPRGLRGDEERARGLVDREGHVVVGDAAAVGEAVARGEPEAHHRVVRTEAAEVVGRRQELRVAVEQRVGQLLVGSGVVGVGQVPVAALVLPARTCAMSGKTRVGLPSAMLCRGPGSAASPRR